MAADEENEKYLRRRKESLLRGQYTSRDRRIQFGFFCRNSSFENLAWEDEQEEFDKLIKRQESRNRRMIISGVVALFLGLLAGWIQEDCKLGIRDFESLEIFATQFKQKCLAQRGTPGSSLKTRE